MEKYRLLIADAAEEFRQALSGVLQEHYCLRQARNGHEALVLLQSFAPDVVVLDLMLPGLDGISLLQKAAELGIRPRVLVTTRLLSDYMTQALERLEVGYVMIKPCDAAAVARRIADLSGCQKPSAPAAPDRHAQISDLLRTLGVPAKLKGYGYLREAVEVFAQDPGQSITKELYRQVGSRCQASVTQVERSIRTAIETAWDHRDGKVWRQYFPAQEQNSASRPTNGEFVARLADRIATEDRHT